MMRSKTNKRQKRFKCRVLAFLLMECRCLALTLMKQTLEKHADRKKQTTPTPSESAAAPKPAFFSIPRNDCRVS